MRFPHGETVTIVRAPVGATDDYGNPVDDWEGASQTVVTECALAPRSEPESGGPDNPAVLIGFQLYAPPGTDIRPTDRVLARGEVFEVDGISAQWANPFTGTDFGVEVALRRSENA